MQMGAFSDMGGMSASSPIQAATILRTSVTACLKPASSACKLVQSIQIHFWTLPELELNITDQLLDHCQTVSLRDMTTDIAFSCSLCTDHKTDSALGL